MIHKRFVHYHDYSSTVINSKRKESPGAICIFRLTGFVPEAGFSWAPSTWDWQRQVGHHGHPPIGRTHCTDN